MGVDGVFGRFDIAAITKDSVTAAGNLITKLKNADLIEPVSGLDRKSTRLNSSHPIPSRMPASA